MKLTDDQQLDRYLARDGWHDGIPEGHFAIRDPHDHQQVTMWRVKAGRLAAWPKEVRNGPVLYRRDIPRDRVAAGRVREAHRAARRVYLRAVVEILAASPQEAAARYAAVTFRCASCNRALRVPASNGYGVGPECRSWMPPELLAEYARRVSLVRAAIEVADTTAEGATS